MKKIEAFIRHEAFEPIRMELLDLGFPSLTISEVKGSGRQKGIVETYRGAVLTNYLRPKIKLECVVADKDAQTIVVALGSVLGTIAETSAPSGEMIEIGPSASDA